MKKKKNHRRAKARSIEKSDTTTLVVEAWPSLVIPLDRRSTFLFHRANSSLSHIVSLIKGYTCVYIYIYPFWRQNLRVSIQWCFPFPLPFQHSGDVFVDQFLVIRPQFLDVGHLVVLRVQIVLAETRSIDTNRFFYVIFPPPYSLKLDDPFQRFHVFRRAKVHVVATRVPRIERMITNHRQSLVG